MSKHNRNQPQGQPNRPSPSATSVAEDSVRPARPGPSEPGKGFPSEMSDLLEPSVEEMEPSDPPPFERMTPEEEAEAAKFEAAIGVAGTKKPPVTSSQEIERMMQAVDGSGQIQGSPQISPSDVAGSLPPIPQRGEMSPPSTSFELTAEQIRDVQILGLRNPLGFLKFAMSNMNLYRLSSFPPSLKSSVQEFVEASFRDAGKVAATILLLNKVHRTTSSQRRYEMLSLMFAMDALMTIADNEAEE